MDLGLCQLPEHHNLIDAVQEFRLESHFHGLLHFVLQGRVGLLLIRLLPNREAESATALRNDLAPNIGGHDHQCILEVDRAPLRVRQAAVLENLQHHVEHVRVGLLDLVEQQHAVRPLAHHLRELVGGERDRQSGNDGGGTRHEHGEQGTGHTAEGKKVVKDREWDIGHRGTPNNEEMVIEYRA